MLKHHWLHRNTPMLKECNTRRVKAFALIVTKLYVTMKVFGFATVSTVEVRLRGDARVVDYTNRPYSKWLDGTITELFNLDPEAIAIVALCKDGTSATTYFNMHNGQRAEVLRAIVQDSLMDYIRVNADIIVEILRQALENTEEEEEGDA